MPKAPPYTTGTRHNRPLGKASGRSARQDRKGGAQALEVGRDRVVVDEERPIGRHRLDHARHALADPGIERENAGVQGRIDGVAELDGQGGVAAGEDAQIRRSSVGRQERSPDTV